MHSLSNRGTGRHASTPLLCASSFLSAQRWRGGTRSPCARPRPRRRHVAPASSGPRPARTGERRSHSVRRALSCSRITSRAASVALDPRRRGGASSAPNRSVRPTIMHPAAPAPAANGPRAAQGEPTSLSVEHVTGAIGVRTRSADRRLRGSRRRRCMNVATARSISVSWWARKGIASRRADVARAGAAERVRRVPHLLERSGRSLSSGTRAKCLRLPVTRSRSWRRAVAAICRSASAKRIPAPASAAPMRP